MRQLRAAQAIADEPDRPAWRGMLVSYSREKFCIGRSMLWCLQYSVKRLHMACVETSTVNACEYAAEKSVVKLLRLPWREGHAGCGTKHVTSYLNSMMLV